MTSRFQAATRAGRMLPVLVAAGALLLGSGCGSRQVQDSLAGSTAQRLVTHSIDELVTQLPDSDFQSLAGKRIYLRSHFIERSEFRDYADQRLALELDNRFDIEMAPNAQVADQVLNVFYTSLGTDQAHLGFFLPLGFVPGVAEGTRINLITLEQFHGISEMYYFLGETGSENRGPLLQARIRTDALGLPIITIPISTLDRP